MRDIKLSVVIPAYNSAETIEDALNSVLHQTAVQYVYEVIVVNDGSTDDTAKVVEEWKKNAEEQFTLVFTGFKKNRGVSAARNRGIEISRGDHIAFLDADDEWKPEKLKIQLGILRRYPGIKALGTGWDQLNLKPGKKVNNSSGYELYGMKVKDELVYLWPPVPSLIVKRNELLKSGMFDESMRYAEDSDFICRLAERAKIYYIPDKLLSAGHGKNPFGEKGLSGNTARMHKGFKKNIYGCLNRGSINILEYAAFLLLEDLKYLRRILIANRIKEEKTKDE